MSKVWFITGAARGIGKSVADVALKNGDSVIATTRRANDFTVPDGCAERVLTFQLDVSDTNQSAFDDAAKRVVEKFGRIDVLLNNAG